MTVFGAATDCASAAGAVRRQDDAGDSEGDEMDAHDHFTARLNVNAAVGAAPSAVSAAAR